MQGVSPVGRLAYPRLFVPRARAEGKVPRFSGTLVFSADVDLEPFKKLARETLAEKYPKGMPRGFRSPFRKGVTRLRDDGTMPEGFKEDDVYVEFWRYAELANPKDVTSFLPPAYPLVSVERDGDGNFLPLQRSDVYAGCYGRFSFRAYCYDKEGNRGLNFNLEAFQKTGDGPAIGNAPVDVNVAFDDIPAGSAAGPVSSASGAATVGDLMGDEPIYDDEGTAF